MRVIGLDHVVVICRDVEASLDFYVGVLGLRVDRRRRVEERPCLLPVGARERVDHHRPTARRTRRTEHRPRLPRHRADRPARARERDRTSTSWRDPSNAVARAAQGWSVYVIDPDGYLIELKQYGTDARGTVSSPGG